MSNGINKPYGLAVVESQIGNGGTQKLGKYSIYADEDGLTTQAQSIFEGDPVKWVDKGTPNSGTKDYKAQAGTIVPKNVAVTAADAESAVAAQEEAPFVGVFIGCAYIGIDGIEVNANYWPGGKQVKKGTRIIAYVNDDPMAVFRVQVSVSQAANVAKTIYLNTQNGLNANLNIAGKTITNNTSSENPRSGSSVYGSAYYLDGSSIASTATLDVKIIGIDNTITGNPNPTGLVPGVDMPFTNLLVKFNKQVYGSSGVVGPDLS